MAEGNTNSASVKATYIRVRFRPVRRQGHEANEVSTGGLPCVELTEARRPDMLRRMRTARTVLRRNVRSFNMDEGHRMLEHRIAIARLRNGSQRIDDRIVRCRDECGGKTRHAAVVDGCGQIADRLGIGAGIEIVAPKAVQLQIEQAERQPQSVIMSAGNDV